MMIGETEVISKDSEVFSLTPHSPIYNIEEGIRLDIPYVYCMKIGFLYEDEINVYWEDNNLFISCLTLDKPNLLKTPTYYYKVDGNPKSVELDDLTCAKFIRLPNDYCNFKIGDKIRYEYQSEKATGTERHLKVSIC